MNTKVIGSFFVFVLTVTSTCFLSFGVFAQTLQDESLKGKTIIMDTNDSHGRIVANEESCGLSGVSALKKFYIDRGAEVILLDAGDTLHGLTTATLDKGQSISKLLDMVGYTAISPGNHDYNYGFEYLYSLTQTANYKVLASNVVILGTNTWAFGYSDLIIEKNRKKIGIFGISTPETVFSTHPNNVKSLIFNDPVETAKAEVKSLKLKGCDYIIALTHLGLPGPFSSRTLAQSVTGIDLIVDGHSHSAMTNGETYGSTTIISSGEYIKNVGVYTIEAKTFELKSREMLKDFRDPVIDAEIAKITERQKKILGEVVTQIPVDLPAERKNVRCRETVIGNVLSDAVRSAANSQIAVMNGGSIRAGIAAGEITKGEIIDVLPFGNYIVVKSIKGQAVKDMLEMGVQLYPEEYGGFLHVSGLTFKFDDKQKAGERVFDVYIAGQPLNLQADYTVAINDFQAAGGDGYEMFKTAKTLSELPAIDEILIKYLSSNPVVDEKIQGRIIIAPKEQYWYF